MNVKAILQKNALQKIFKFENKEWNIGYFCELASDLDGKIWCRYYFSESGYLENWTIPEDIDEFLNLFENDIINGSFIELTAEDVSIFKKDKDKHLFDLRTLNIKR
jgi:hypothetical protein